MTLLEHIVNNPMKPIRYGLCIRPYDGKLFRFSQNRSEIRANICILFEPDPEILKLADIDCVINGLPFESGFVRSEPGAYVMSYYDIVFIQYDNTDEDDKYYIDRYQKLNKK